MCGITGIINIGGRPSCQSKQLLSMTNMIRHRGPDDEGYILIGAKNQSKFFGDDTPEQYIEYIRSSSEKENHIKNAYSYKSTIALGHRRLSIIDLSPLGHQPMSYKDRYCIVYNGEIFNYIELKEELKKYEYIFRSNSDTEVIMAAYDKWGTSCLKKFNGMWAFALYDFFERTLFISRDRFGIKPLYYYIDNRFFIFASEIKSIIASGYVDRSPNIKYCKKYIKHGALDHTEETAFKNIYRFSPSSYIELKVDEINKKNVVGKKFWHYMPNLSNEQYDQTKAVGFAKKYYELLTDAVRIRLRADVKIGAALSGGLDSSSIVYLINEVLNNDYKGTIKQETFSSVYKADGVQYCDESKFIDELSTFLEVNSNQIEPKVDQIISEHRKMIYAMENPPGGSNMGGWYTFLCVANKGIKINLDGQGADEQLAGYFKYIWNYFVFLPVKDVLQEYQAFKHLPGLKKEKLILCIILNLLYKLFLMKYWYGIFKSILPEKLQLLLMPVNQRLYEDTNGYLATLIHYGDSQSMAHSVESRLPFMDYRLVEFLSSIPGCYKIHDGWTKFISRFSLNKKLPDKITWRKDKMGWPDPMEYWFRGELKEWLCTEIENSVFLRKVGVGKKVRIHINNKKAPIEKFVRQLNLAIWYKVFFK